MHERPDGVLDADILVAVQAGWPEAVDGVDAVEHLPVGFGAHHWRASADGEPRLFVTLDVVGVAGARHADAGSLHDAYATAAELARSVDAVHAGLAPWVVPCGSGPLSVTPWLDAVRPAALDEPATAAVLDALHRATPPATTPRWRTVVPPGLADDLASRVRRPWTAGPHGERVRTALVERLDDVHRWVARHHHLASVAPQRPWVVTHGEPGLHNQLVTADGRLLLVDWESVRLAPAERDLRTLDRGDPEMLELFDLEWRLEEVGQYAAWFEGPHADTADARTAVEGLMEELERPGYPRSGRS
ncbi:hypothetical protein GCM10023340_31650 [Nocardioides marinquilinus]|uniref:Spectinomycin phosphotransferase n=1 Tax=Nocardioides marinquilinus TaxID=1210400 RepID=A0ABP9PW68_9ACTN